MAISDAGSGDFAALLPPGRHPMDLATLRALCVAEFPVSRTRSRLMEGLENLTTLLSEAGIEGDIWVDGSFLTEKTDPADIDIVVRLRGEFIEAATGQQAKVIGLLEEDLHDLIGCDAYILVEWAEGHQDYWVGQMSYAYWMRQWGMDRSDNLKGMAEITLQPTMP